MKSTSNAVETSVFYLGRGYTLRDEASGYDENGSPSGMGHCWVCDALAPVLTNEKGEVTGTTCGCDDYGYTDGADGVWR